MILMHSGFSLNCKLPCEKMVVLAKKSNNSVNVNKRHAWAGNTSETRKINVLFMSTGFGHVIIKFVRLFAGYFTYQDFVRL